MAGRREEAIAKLAVIFVIAVGFLGWIGGGLIDGWTPDARGSFADAWVWTRDVAAGDPVAVTVQATNADDASIKKVVAGWSGGPKTNIDATGAGKELGFTVDVPADAHGGDDAKLELDLEAWGRKFINSNEHQTLPVHLEVPVKVRAAGAATMRKVVDGAVAVLAWLACAALALLAFAKAGGPKAPEPMPGVGGPEIGKAGMRFLGRLLIIVVLAFGVLGRVVFAWPLLRITPAQGAVIDLALAGLWALAPGLGALVGLRRAAREARWLPLRVRPVMGRGNLMPALDRPCEAKDEAAVRAALGAEPRLLTKLPAPWRVDQLDLRVHDDVDAAPIVARLAALYGPVEWSLAGGAPAIVD